MEILLGALTIITSLWYFWDKIVAWWRPINLAENPTRENVEKVIMGSNPSTDWNRESNAVHSIASYKKDLNLRFEIKYTDDGIQNNDFKEPWANRHPDPSATGYWCDLYYSSTLVERFVLVAVDGGRAMLPLPKVGPQGVRPNEVLPFEHKIAQIHDTIGTLESYMKRSGLSVYRGTA
jgi:hypothetical protein